MPPAESRFVDEVRQELSRLALGTGDEVRAELAAIVRFGGGLARRGGEPGVRVEVTTSSGAVARRAYALLQHRYDLRPELLVRAPDGMRSTSVFGVHVIAGGEHVARDLGLVGGPAVGSLVDGSTRGATTPDGGDCLSIVPDGAAERVVAAFLRGVVLTVTSISAPGRPSHLEIVVNDAASADAVAGLLRARLEATVGVVAGRRPRVVLKSGRAIGDLLVVVGASRAFLRWDERRLRRQLRNEANRLANADAANLRRSTGVATAQVRAVERLVASAAWEEVDDGLRAVALARIANPEASLTELAALLDPPIGRSAVHRRLRRLEELARQADEG